MKLRVPDLPGPKRLDRFLREAVPELSRSAFYSALRKGRIRVNGARALDAGCSVGGGEEVAIEGFARGGATAEHGAARSGPPLSILFEDDALLVVNKPAGLPVHPGAGRKGPNLIDSLRGYAERRGFTPYLVHRLDRHTSGAIVAAKSREIAGALGALFKERSGARVEKRYLSLVLGKPAASGAIDEPLDGKPAGTRFWLKESFRWSGGPAALVEVATSSGRRHQIRRHLASAGLPVAGDELYGDWALNRLFAKELRARGFLLHALSVTLPHPLSRVPMTFVADPPAELQRIIEILRRPPSGGPPEGA